MSNRKTPAAWICIGAPLATAAGVFIARAALEPAAFERLMMSERGLVELMTVVVLLPAIIMGMVAARHHRGLPRLWLGCLAVGCIYFAGEELSWGQHLFGWSTPEAMQRLNDQQETNLHNISSWLDQKPRLLLELWVLGLTLAALWPRFRQWWGRWDFLWNGRRLALAGLLALAVRLPERLSSWFDLALPPLFDFRLAELQELMFAWVLLLYLWRAASSISSNIR